MMSNLILGEEARLDLLVSHTRYTRQDVHGLVLVSKLNRPKLYSKLILLIINMEAMENVSEMLFTKSEILVVIIVFVASVQWI